MTDGTDAVQVAKPAANAVFMALARKFDPETAAKIDADNAKRDEDQGKRND